MKPAPLRTFHLAHLIALLVVSCSPPSSQQKQEAVSSADAKLLDRIVSEPLREVPPPRLGDSYPRLTIDGQTFEQARLLAVTEAGIQLTHANGEASFSLEQLPLEWQIHCRYPNRAIVPIPRLFGKELAEADRVLGIAGRAEGEFRSYDKQGLGFFLASEANQPVSQVTTSYFPVQSPTLNEALALTGFIMLNSHEQTEVLKAGQTIPHPAITDAQKMNWRFEATMDGDKVSVLRLYPQYADSK